MGDNVETGSEAPALILGATSDIAIAIADRLGAQGRPLQLAGRDIEQLERIATDLRLRHSVEVQVLRFDALEIDEHRAFMDMLDPVPSLVISAVGLLGDQERDASDPAAADMIMRSNYNGPALALEEAARRLLAQGQAATIVGFCSVAGDRGRAKNYIYGSAKAGLATYLSGLGQKLAPTNVHVLIVKPGFVRTRMTAQMDLPGLLTSDPGPVADRVLNAIRSGKSVVYTRGWSLVMAIIRNLPDFIFKRMKF